jgi:myotubularin-related protein 6/7/8
MCDSFQVPYPLIALVTRQPQTLRGLSPLSFRTRTIRMPSTFSTVSRSSPSTVRPRPPFRIAVLTLKLPDFVYQLYAFFYEPNPPLAESNGWSIYSPREEFGRMGVGTRSKAWRFTTINQDYSVRTLVRNGLRMFIVSIK